MASAARLRPAQSCGFSACRPPQAPGASLEVHVGCEHPEMGHFFDAMLQATSSAELP